MAKNSVKKLAVIAALTAAAGYAVGILTAPKSGKETRADIKRTADKGLSEAEKRLKQVSNELADLLSEAKKRGADLSGKASKELESLTGKASDAREKVREIMSAVHEGDASDEDLNTAMKQASSALQHLRDYLKK